MRRLEISRKRSAGMSLQRKDGATEKQYIYPDIEDGINGVRICRCLCRKQCKR